MRLSTNVPGSRLIQSANLVNNNTLAPSQAFASLMNLGPFTFQGVKTRFRFECSAGISGTTNTLRTGSFRLTEDAAVVGLAGTQVQLPADNAGAGVYKSTAGIDLIRIPAAGSHTYHIQWQTSANATLNVDASDLSLGFATFSIEELESGAGSDVAPIADECLFDCVQATDPKSLAAQIQQSFARFLVIDPDMALVDINLEGGGAGGVLQAVLIYRLPQLGPQPVAYPRVDSLAAAVSFGTERFFNRLSLNKIVADQPGASLEFWSGVVIGDGAMWIQVVLYIPEEGEGEGLLVTPDMLGRSVDAEVVKTQLRSMRDAASERRALARAAEPETVTAPPVAKRSTAKKPVGPKNGTRPTPYNEKPPPSPGAPKAKGK